jgi:hypothetical protein
MGDIYDTTSQFEFDKISLTTPTTISGGVHFSKILINKKQLYIQSPKCKTKQGILKSSKKSHADLVFTNDDEEFIQWVETLEQTVRKHIFANRERWFDMDLDEDDIESYFTPTIKLFKSGKQYIMRVNISQRVGATPLKIYDENEDDVDVESITENTSLISILEIQGIRCSTKSFQIDVELKQIMVIKPVNLFEKCIIKRTVAKDLAKKVDVVVEEAKSKIDDTVTKQEVEQEEAQVTLEDAVEEVIIDQEDDVVEEEEEEEESKKNDNDDIVEEEEESKKNDDQHEDDDILEINLDVEEINDSDTIHLKDKTEVYYQMYKEARQKAKLAKSLALSSYLEARRIKNLYMLDDIDDSDESDLEEK